MFFHINYKLSSKLNLSPRVSSDLSAGQDEDEIVNYFLSFAPLPDHLPDRGEVREVPEFVLSGSVQELRVCPQQQPGSVRDQLPGEPLYPPSPEQTDMT